MAKSIKHFAQQLLIAHTNWTSAVLPVRDGTDYDATVTAVTGFFGRIGQAEMPGRHIVWAMAEAHRRLRTGRKPRTVTYSIDILDTDVLSATCGQWFAFSNADASDLETARANRDLLLTANPGAKLKIVKIVTSTKTVE